MLGFGNKICKEGHYMDPTWDICPVCLAPICAWLVVMNGKNKNKVYTIHEGKSKIGSGLDCEVRILLKEIHRHHATLICERSKVGDSEVINYILHNHLDEEKLQINNKPVTSEEIIDGDIINMEGIEFKFKCL